MTHYALTFEVEPDFLAVGAPGVVVAVEGYADVFGVVAEEAEGGLGVGGAVYLVWFGDEVG